jgi:Iron-sulfur cluster assembly accessory protein
MDTIVSSPIHFSYSAVDEIKRLMKSTELKPDQYLRVGVKGGGCSGMTYILDFDTKQGDDEIYESDGFRFIMNNSHQIYLYGMEIDWQDGLNSRGFVFKNPNATSTCGCGSSFAV